MTWLFQTGPRGIRRFPVSPPRRPAIVLAALLAALAPFRDAAASVVGTSVVDHCVRPVSWNYNQAGGGRGTFGIASFALTNATEYACRISTDGGFLGMWYSIGHPTVDKPSYNPLALYSPVIHSNYQPRLVGLDLHVGALDSPAGVTNLELRAELKGYTAGVETLRASTSWVGRVALTNGPFPKVFTWDLDPAALGTVGVIAWVLDKGMTGDRIDLDAVKLRVQMPELSVEKEAFLTSLALLLDNYDAASGMVQDRSYWGTGVMENITASAKLAKLLAMALRTDLVDPTAASNAIVKIADTLTHVVPRGPPGVDQVLTHFSANGGTAVCPGSEWSSGDAAFAALDLMVALQMIGDPEDQMSDAFGILQNIDWPALLHSSGYFRMGYATNGTMLRGRWAGFGMETFGVMLAALAADGILATNTYVWPPSRNGSGFIAHAGYPVIASGLDRWGVDWDPERAADTDVQINWYADPAHENTNLFHLGLFGLSAGEDPGGTSYVAYGVGGTLFGAEDGGHRVVTPHYCGMIAALRPAACSQMWSSMKSLELLGPLNNVESLAVDPAGGAIEEVNYLRGSWNMALQAEGWALADTNIERAVRDAFLAIPSLSNAYAVLMTPRTATLEIAADPEPRSAPVPLGYGTTTVVWGSLQTSSVPSPVDESNGTRYACAGCTYQLGSYSNRAPTNAVIFRAADTTRLIWRWWPEHWVGLTNDGGSVIDFAQGWYRHGYWYDLVPSAGASRVFSHWTTNGTDAGSAIPFPLCVDTNQDLAAVFVNPFMDVTAHASVRIIDWAPHGSATQWLATVELCATSGGWALSADFWLGIDTNGGAYLEFDDGATPDGRRYVDATDGILGQLPGVGDGDAVLDPGECVQVTNLAVVRDAGMEPIPFAWATWDAPPANTNYDDLLADTDRDGMPNGWEDGAELDRHNPFDAAEDADQDKVDNRSEYVADTDPNYEYSYLGMEELGDMAKYGAPGMWYVTWFGGTGATQYVDYLPFGSEEWETLATNAPPTPDWDYLIITTRTERVGFFRVRAER